MNLSGSQSVSIDAPAKLNLGLEIQGPRRDGFHEITTIFTTVSLADHLTARPARSLQVVADIPDLDPSHNLVAMALHGLRAAMQVETGARVTLKKRIPLAAGLGGASSDAAAALLLGRELWRLAITDEQLEAIGVGIGSDVPFFIHGGCALGRGKGERLTPVPLSADVWFVVVVPAITIPGKTARLYGSLTPSDFSDGSLVEAQAACLRSGLDPDPGLLGNAFRRPLYALLPEFQALAATMADAGCPFVAISGAGPTHYSMVVEPDRAEAIARRLRDQFRNQARIFVVQPVSARQP